MADCYTHIGLYFTPPLHPSPKYTLLKEKVNFSLNNTKAHRDIEVLFPCISNFGTRLKPVVNTTPQRLYFWDNIPLRSRYSDCLRAGRSGDRITVGARFSAPVQTGPEAHPASCTMGTGSFPGVRYGRGVTLTSHPF